jgi:hypothetical protein
VLGSGQCGSVGLGVEVAGRLWEGAEAGFLESRGAGLTNVVIRS